MVTCQSSELGWEVTVELPADFLSLGRGSVKLVSEQVLVQLKESFKRKVRNISHKLCASYA